MSRWVESERSDERAGASLLNLTGLIEQTVSVSETLFGFSKRVRSGTQPDFTPLAHQRGWSPKPLAEGRTEMNAVAAMETQFGKDAFGGATDIDIREILTAGLSAFGIGDPAEFNWHAVVEAVDRLRKHGGLQDAGFGTVCGANW